jgi:hypothetical protein
MKTHQCIEPSPDPRGPGIHIGPLVLHPDFLVTHNEHKLAALAIIQIFNPPEVNRLMSAIQETPEGPEFIRAKVRPLVNIQRK